MRILRRAAVRLLSTSTAGLVAFAAFASPLFAEERESIRVVYEARAKDCPTESAFVAELTARTTLVNVVDANERRTFTVNVDPARGGLTHGSLTIATLDRTAKREVAGRSCKEVVSALALMAALAIDAHASTKPIAELTPPPAPTPDPAQIPAPIATTASPVPDPLVVQEPPPPPIRDTSAPPPAAPAAPSSRWSLAIGASGALRSGVLPRGAPELGGFVDVGLVRGARSQIALFSPSARVTVLGAPSQTMEVQGAAASFSFVAARLDLCPARVALTPSMHGVACVIGEAGALGASASGLRDAQNDTRTWLALGGDARARWAPTGPIFFEATLGAIAPLRADRFYAGNGNAPQATFYRVSPIGLWVGLSLGVLFFS